MLLKGSSVLLKGSSVLLKGSSVMSNNIVCTMLHGWPARCTQLIIYIHMLLP